MKVNQPRKGSIPKLIYDAINEATVPMNSESLLTLKLARDGKEITRNQIHQSLHALAAKGHIVKKKAPGKGQRYLYYKKSKDKPEPAPEHVCQPSAKETILVSAVLNCSVTGLLLAGFDKGILMKLIEEVECG